ncbi:hypothetical protein SLS55_000346 [Diplodia seriata]|uniref:NmrA-like domain-containing protein n=1 Tax=Diplodia seriata TaxID=420778 RepID=A0ABR3CU22_9PEZI
MTVDHENDLLLITCASGKQASRLLALLHNKWKRLRLVVNSPSSEQRLKQQYPGADVTRASLENVDEARRIMAGVATVCHIGPSFHPHETEMGYFMIDAAVEEARHGTFKHFVYSSVLNTQLRKMMNHDCKRYVEEYLMESGLNYTILQPTHFMDNFPVAQLLSQPEPVYRANWNTSIPFSFIALQDLAEAAATVIEERDKHYLAQYPLSSTRAISYDEVIQTVGQAIGKNVRVETRPVTEAADALLTMLFGGADKAHPRTRDIAQRMILFYNYHGLKGNPNVLEWLIGRKPTAHAEWVRAQVQNAESRKTG